MDTPQLNATITRQKQLPDAEGAINPAHYNQCKIEPIDFIQANNLDFVQGNIVKYIVRYRQKNGIEDLKKVIRYAQYAIRELEQEIQMDLFQRRNRTS